MRKILMLAVLAAAVCAFAAPKKCNGYDSQIRNFEKRFDLVNVMKGAEVKRELSYDPDGTSRVRKYSKPIKSGQYMGLRQYAVYGFLGCKLHSVRVGKVNPETESKAAEATIYLRDNGKPKAMCSGSGGVLRIRPFDPSNPWEPNPNCVCYDGNGIERAPRKGKWCAESEDYDMKRYTLSSDYIDFVIPGSLDDIDLDADIDE